MSSTSSINDGSQVGQSTPAAMRKEIAAIKTSTPRPSTPQPIVVASVPPSEPADVNEARTLAQSPISDSFPPTGTAPPTRPATAPLPTLLSSTPLDEKGMKKSENRGPGDTSRRESYSEKPVQPRHRNPLMECFMVLFCCRSDTAATAEVAPIHRPGSDHSVIPGIHGSTIQRPMTSGGVRDHPVSTTILHPTVQQLQKQQREGSLRGTPRGSVQIGVSSMASTGTAVSAAGAAANPVTQHIVLAPEKEIQQQVHASQAALAAAYAGGDEVAQNKAARLTAGELEPQYLLPPLDEAHQGRKCLVLDLDETLVHSSFKMIPSPDFVVPVEIEGQVHNVYVLKRPGVDEFMRRVGEQFEIVVFTASLAKYADPVLDLLDKYQVVHHRLFREACLNYKGNYVKDLSQLGRDIRHTIIIDNSPASYILHPTNAIPVTSWFSDPHDTELVDMIPFLSDMAGNVDDVTQVLDGAYEEEMNGADILDVAAAGEGDSSARLATDAGPMSLGV